MSELRVNTDIMRKGALVISKATSDISAVTSRVSGLASQIGGEFQGQLRDKVRPILSGLSSQGSQLQSHSAEVSANLSGKASGIDAVMQSNNISDSGVFTSSGASPMISLFSRVSGFLAGGIAGLLGVVGLNKYWFTVFRPNSMPIPTPIPTPTPTPGSVNPEPTSSSAEENRAALGVKLVKQYDGHSYANGTYNSSDSYSARPVNPPVTNAEGDRDPNIYNAALNQFGVETNPRYAQRNDNTYCNIYVWDVTRAMGAEIPHWVDPNGAPVNVGKGAELSANGVVNWLGKYGGKYGWHVVTAKEAQAYANKGSPAVAVWPNQGGIGHVAVIRPGDYSATQGPAIAQAGSQNLNSTRVSKTFGSGWSRNQIIYYAHD